MTHTPSPFEAMDVRAPVLIAEDDAATRLRLQRTIEGWGHTVVAVADGRAALERLREGAARLVVCDWQMPGLSGPELCRRLREGDDGGLYVYVILLTIRHGVDAVVEGLEAGADDFLSKPFHAAELRARLAVGYRTLQLVDELQRTNVELRDVNRILEGLARTDPLMRIGNRRGFEECVVRVHSEACRHRLPYGLLMADVDCFKAYNDACGHPAGDEVLARLAEILRDCARAEDMLFRYGGEEIVFLLRPPSRTGLAAAGERFRQRVEQAQLPHPGYAAGIITLSFGGALFDPGELAHGGSLPWQSVVEAADRALYAAKRAGRNCVRLAASDPAAAPA